jgi:hypothetical protein
VEKYKFDPEWMKDPEVMKEVFRDTMKERDEYIEKLRKEVEQGNKIIEEQGDTIKTLEITFDKKMKLKVQELIAEDNEIIVGYQNEIKELKEKVRHYEMMYHNTGAMFNRMTMKEKIEQLEKENENLKGFVKYLQSRNKDMININDWNMKTIRHLKDTREVLKEQRGTLTEDWETRDLIEIKNDWKKLAQEQVEKIEKIKLLADSNFSIEPKGTSEELLMEILKVIAE